MWTHLTGKKSWRFYDIPRDWPIYTNSTFSPKESDIYGKLTLLSRPIKALIILCYKYKPNSGKPAGSGNVVKGLPAKRDAVYVHAAGGKDK